MTTPPSDTEESFFGSEEAAWAAGWLEELLACASPEEVQEFVENRSGPETTASAEDFLMLKALVHTLYETGCAPSEEGWRRVRLALSALRPAAVEEVREAMVATDEPNERPSEVVAAVSEAPAVSVKVNAPRVVPTNPPAGTSPWASSRGGGVSGGVSGAPAPPIPLAHYAAIVVGTEGRDAAQAGAIQAQYGIDDGAHRARIDEAFSALFRADPTQRAEYEEQLSRYRSWRSVSVAEDASQTPAPSAADGLDSTEFMAPIDPDTLAKSTPFQGQAAPPSSAVDDEPHPAAGGTAAVNPAEVAAAVTSAFSPVPEGAPMQVERYAIIVLLTEGATDARRQEVHEQYGIGSEEERSRLDQEFGRALRRSDALRRDFERALEEWKSLRRSPSS